MQQSKVMYWIAAALLLFVLVGGMGAGNPKGNGETLAFSDFMNMA